jgi:hypothetical protein
MAPDRSDRCLAFACPAYPPRDRGRRSLTELSASPWHDHAADRLKDILKDAGKLAGAQVYIARGPNDIATPAEVRAGHTLTASEPFTIGFDPRVLTELE